MPSRKPKKLTAKERTIPLFPLGKPTEPPPEIPKDILATLSDERFVLVAHPSMGRARFVYVHAWRNHPKPVAQTLGAKPIRQGWEKAGLALLRCQTCAYYARKGLISE